MKILDLEQGSDHWVSYRQRCACASEWATILDMNPYETRLELWNKKMGLATAIVTNRMKEGLAIEEEARSWFHREYGREVKPMVATHDDNDFLLASFDGINTESRVILEIKNIKQDYHEMACSGKIPELYYPQIQAQLYVSGYEHAHFLSYKKSNPAVVIVPRDDAFIEKVLPKIEDFIKCIRTYYPPDPCERDYTDLSGNMNLTGLMAEYKDLRDKIALMDNRCNEIKGMLKQLTDDKNSKGLGWKYTKYMIKGRVDYDALLDDLKIQPEICDGYRKKPSIGYKITFNDNEGGR